MKNIFGLSKFIVTRALVIGVGAVSIFLLNSFMVRKAGEDFLKILGMSRSVADEKISGGFLDGSIETYGIKNLRSIAVGNRGVMTKDILAYSKAYVQSPAFKKQYDEMRDHYKPKPDVVLTPDELQKNEVTQLRKNIADNEASLKKSDANMKPIFEKISVELKKHLAEAEAGSSKHFIAYKKNFSQLQVSVEERNKMLLQKWEEKYPADYAIYIKPRLEEFLRITENIDYAAQLVTKNNMKVFVNREYENMDNRRKMAFRAGKEVVEPARTFVQQWLSEIK